VPFCRPPGEQRLPGRGEPSPLRRPWTGARGGRINRLFPIALAKPALRTPIARGREDEFAVHFGDDRYADADRTGPGPTCRPRILGCRGPSQAGESASSDKPGKAVDLEDHFGGIRGLGAQPAGPDQGSLERLRHSGLPGEARLPVMSPRLDRVRRATPPSHPGRHVPAASLAGVPAMADRPRRRHRIEGRRSPRTFSPKLVACRFECPVLTP
jgi:hypothetical protein